VSTKLTDVVRELVLADPCTAQLLSSGVVNYTALAKRLRPGIERLTRESVRLNTIVQALRRLATKAEPVDYFEIANSIAEADYHIVRGITEVSLPLKEFPEFVSKLTSSHISQDSLMILFVAEGSVSVLLDRSLAHSLNLKPQKEYTLLEIVIKGKAGLVPGSSAYIAQVLGFQKITPSNIIRRANQLFVLFSGEEMSQVLKAVEVLQKTKFLR
jgi:hypothetical protein